MEIQKPHILVVDDDDRLRDLILRYLQKNDVLVNAAHDAKEAEELLSYMSFDLMVLDVMMPGENGFAFTKRLRAKEINIPVLLLTAKGEIDDRVEGLQSGADDYLTKPFEPKELLLRVQAILRRINKKQKAATRLRFGNFYFDFEREQLTDGIKIIDLTKVEATLLKILAKKPGDVFTREQLAEITEQDPSSRTIDVQITRLRKKIEKNPKVPRYLQTVRGSGYVLRPEYD